MLAQNTDTEIGKADATTSPMHIHAAAHHKMNPFAATKDKTLSMPGCRRYTPWFLTETEKAHTTQPRAQVIQNVSLGVQQGPDDGLA